MEAAGTCSGLGHGVLASLIFSSEFETLPYEDPPSSPRTPVSVTPKADFLPTPVRASRGVRVVLVPAHHLSHPSTDVTCTHFRDGPAGLARICGHDSEVTAMNFWRFGRALGSGPG